VLKIVDHEQRRREYAYLSAMQKADAGDYGPLGNSLPAPCTTTSTASSCRVSPARLVLLASLADKHLSVAALRRAAQRARLAATHGPTASGAVRGRR